MNRKYKLDDIVVDLSGYSWFRELALRIDDQTLRCVAFLGIPAGTEDAGADWLGTAFFADVLSFDESLTHVYLVTAKHIADRLEGREFYIGLNHKDGCIAYFGVPAAQKWWRHPTTPDEVDVAVLPWMPPPDQIEMRSLRVQEWFLTQATIQQQDIGPGDEVCAIGLFTKMSGRGKLIPIVRTGNIAMMPNEKIPGIKINDQWTGEVEAYLIEARSIGGMSGSPVFVRETVYNKTEDKETKTVTSVFHGMGFQHFLGMVHGHWEIRATERNSPRIQALQRDTWVDQVNLGIAVVIPCHKIIEVLNHPDLIARRQAEEAKRSDKDASQPSASSSDSTEPPQ
jgi:hypothetical protein